MEAHLHTNWLYVASLRRGQICPTKHPLWGWSAKNRILQLGAFGASLHPPPSRCLVSDQWGCSVDLADHAMKQSPVETSPNFCVFWTSCGSYIQARLVKPDMNWRFTWELHERIPFCNLLPEFPPLTLCQGPFIQVWMDLNKLLLPNDLSRLSRKNRRRCQYLAFSSHLGKKSWSSEIQTTKARLTSLALGAWWRSKSTTGTIIGLSHWCQQDKGDEESVCAGGSSGQEGRFVTNCRVGPLDPGGLIIPSCAGLQTHQSTMGPHTSPPLVKNNISLQCEVKCVADPSLIHGRVSRMDTAKHQVVVAQSTRHREPQNPTSVQNVLDGPARNDQSAVLFSCSLTLQTGFYSENKPFRPWTDSSFGSSCLSGFWPRDHFLAIHFNFEISWLTRTDQILKIRDTCKIKKNSNQVLVKHNASRLANNKRSQPKEDKWILAKYEQHISCVWYYHWGLPLSDLP